ncbi:hypothetical protein L596_013312 [Steinernema carpocapsae]|uniref:Uncharacterized protein n=1 Tax=Steinernema carpocapsae TaxID=34508 RepID=A0A4U5P0A4_STECR|nr:hypothetical protein L596_013312 [Steinernema carpocapsae]
MKEVFKKCAKTWRNLGLPEAKIVGLALIAFVNCTRGSGRKANEAKPMFKESLGGREKFNQELQLSNVASVQKSQSDFMNEV